MLNFIVKVKEITYQDLEIQAENADKAKEIAESLMDEQYVMWDGDMYYSVEKIIEVKKGII